jgi:hypothetical protein
MAAAETGAAKTGGLAWTPWIAMAAIFAARQASRAQGKRIRVSRSDAFWAISSHCVTHIMSMFDIVFENRGR